MKKTQISDIRLPTSQEAFQLQRHKARGDETSTQPDSSILNESTVGSQMTYDTSTSIQSTNTPTQNALQEKPAEKPNQPTPGSLVRDIDQLTLGRPAEELDQPKPDDPAGEPEQNTLNSPLKTPDQPLPGESPVMLPARPTIETSATVPHPLGKSGSLSSVPGSIGKGALGGNTIRGKRKPKFMMWVCVSVSMLLMESSA